MVANIEQLIAGVDQLETSELETFVVKANSLLARRKVESLSIEETELLQTINKSLPTELEARYAALQSKIHEETITEPEHEELVQLISVVEKSEVDRLEALFSLSQLRQVSLPDLMNQLGIQAPPVHG